MRIGILGTADIAFRRFLPALRLCPEMAYAGVASRTVEKTQRFIEAYGGRGYTSYEELLADESIDAVYIPLPPALHYSWGKKALLAGKHLFMEKPFTTDLSETEELLHLAEERDLVVHENYMFLYHSQLQKVKELIENGALGELRMIRAAFGFPKRGEGDFRYDKALGGGALLDCGGYPVRLALELLGMDAKVTQARLIRPEGYEVELFGNAVLENEGGLCAQVSFGIDNAYQCQLEVWGSKATLIAARIFTAGPELKPPMLLRTSTGEEAVETEADDHFKNSLWQFQRCEKDRVLRDRRRSSIRQGQALIEQIALRGRDGKGESYFG